MKDKAMALLILVPILTSCDSPKSTEAERAASVAFTPCDKSKPIHRGPTENPLAFPPSVAKKMDFRRRCISEAEFRHDTEEGERYGFSYSHSVDEYDVGVIEALDERMRRQSP
jgi:hypothetical protein